MPITYDEETSTKLAPIKPVQKAQSNIVYDDEVTSNTDEGALAAGTRGAVEAVVPGFAGLAGFGAGMKAAAPMAARAAAATPGHPIAKGLVGGAVALTGGFAGAFGASSGAAWVQDKLHAIVDPEGYKNSQTAKKQYPTASAVGSVVGGLAGMSPKTIPEVAGKFFTKPIVQRSVSAGLTGTLDVGQQAATEDSIDWTRAGAAAAGGFAAPGFNPAGKAAYDVGGKIIPGRTAPGGGIRPPTDSTEAPKPLTPSEAGIKKNEDSLIREFELGTNPNKQLDQAAFLDTTTGDYIKQGARHDELLKKNPDLVAGFLLKDGTFVTRKEAATIAKDQHADKLVEEIDPKEGLRSSNFGPERMDALKAKETTSSKEIDFDAPSGIKLNREDIGFTRGVAPEKLRAFDSLVAGTIVQNGHILSANKDTGVIIVDAGGGAVLTIDKSGYGDITGGWADKYKGTPNEKWYSSLNFNRSSEGAAFSALQTIKEVKRQILTKEVSPHKLEAAVQNIVRDKRVVEADILRTIAEQQKRSRLLGNDVELAAYAKDRGISTEEMRKLLEDNFIANVENLKNFQEEIKTASKADTSDIKFTDKDTKSAAQKEDDIFLKYEKIKQQHEDALASPGKYSKEQVEALNQQRLSLRAELLSAKLATIENPALRKMALEAGADDPFLNSNNISNVGDLVRHLKGKFGDNHYISQMLDVLNVDPYTNTFVLSVDEFKRQAQKYGASLTAPAFWNDQGIFIAEGRGTNAIVVAHEIGHAALATKIEQIQALPANHPDAVRLKKLVSNIENILADVKSKVDLNKLSLRGKDKLTYALSDVHEFISDGLFQPTVIQELMAIDRANPNLGFIDKILKAVSDFFGMNSKQYTAFHDLIASVSKLSEVDMPNTAAYMQAVDPNSTAPRPSSRAASSESAPAAPTAVDPRRYDPRRVTDEADFKLKGKELYASKGEAAAREFIQGYERYKQDWLDPVKFVEDAVDINLNNQMAIRRNVTNNAERFKEMVPDAATREQVAIAIDAKKTDTLTGPAKALADKYTSDMKDIGERALKEGVVKGLLTDYVTHIVNWADMPKGALDTFLSEVFKRAGDPTKKTTTESRFGMERKIETFTQLERVLADINKRIAETALAGKDFRLEIKTKDIAEIYKQYGLSMEKAIENKKLVESVLSTRNPAGESLIRRVTDESPLPRGWEMLNNRQFAGYAVHPDLVPALKFAFETKGGTILNALYTVSQATKRLNVIASFFHAKSLLEVQSSTGIPIYTPLKEVGLGIVDKVQGTELSGIRKAVEQFKKGGLGDSVDKWIRGGLVLEIPQDVKIGVLGSIGKFADSMIGKYGPKTHILESALTTTEKYTLGITDKITWDYLHTGGKLYVADKYLERARIDHAKTEAKRLEKAKEVSDESLIAQAKKWADSTKKYDSGSDLFVPSNPKEKQIAFDGYYKLLKDRQESSLRERPFDEAASRKEITSFVNKSFGGLNWFQEARSVQNEFGKRMAMAAYSPEGRKYLQLLLFAPDWTISTIKAFTAALPKELNPLKMHPIEGIKGMATPSTQADYARLYQFKTAITYLTLLNGINLLTADRPIWENKDPTRIEFDDGTSMQAMKHAMEPYHWIADPAKTLTNKLGFLPKASIVATTGLEYPSPYAPKMVDPSAFNRAKAIVSMALPFQVSAAISAPEGEGLKRALYGTGGIPLYGSTPEQRKAMNKERTKQIQEKRKEYKEREREAGR